MENNEIQILKLASLTGLVIAVLGIMYFVLKTPVISNHPVGLIIQISAIGLMIWARFTFGIRSFHASANTTKGELITNGPYRWFRHPIYSSIIYFVWAGVLTQPTAKSIGAALLVSFGLILRMLLEERFLMLAYVEYKEYSRHTKRLIPFVF